MSRYSRFVFLSGMLLFVLLFSLACPGAAYADDGAPPPPATEEPAQPPAEEDEPEAVPPPTEESAPPLTEAPVVQETVATEAPAATEVPVEEADGASPIAESEGEEVSDEPGAIEELTVGEVLEAAPEGTQVVVLDENGEVLPLVSTEAAEIVATADPMWCPVIAGVPTLPGGAGCSPNFGTPQALIDNMDVTDPQTPGLGLYEQPGIIYFTADLTDPGNSFILIRGGLDDDVAWSELYDADYDALKGYDLILQGGWSGVNGDTSFTQTNFGANPVQIGTDTNPWVGNIIIKDITIEGATGTGLTVYTEGDINLDHVTSSNNSDGALLESDGFVQVSESNFDGNLGSGLGVSSGGGITLSNVNASGNRFGGAVLFTGGDVSVSNSNFDGNAIDEGTGLSIFSIGNVNLDTVSASSNTNAFGNGFGGDILTLSGVTIKNSTFNGNGDGLWVAAFLGDATIKCSQFKNNSDVGVDGVDVAGVFTLNDVTFSQNAVDYDGTPVILSGGCKVVVAGKGAGAKPSSQSLPLHIVPVSGGEQIELDCGAYSGTKLILPNGDRVTLPCPIKDQGILTGKGQEQLPAPLNAPFDFTSALEVQVIRNSEALSRVNIGMTIDFTIPDGQQGADFTILRWDAEASQWVEVSGGTQTGDGHFVATSNFTGIYVLVTK